LGTLGIVGIALTALGLPFGLALLLASIATATAPAATSDVIKQSGDRQRLYADIARDRGDW
jgi:NhaP-type Na+/H+ or K+/H+ antiporter